MYTTGSGRSISFYKPVCAFIKVIMLVGLSFCILYLMSSSVIKLSAQSVPSGTGVFWQVSDFHYDFNYSQSGSPKHMCHSGYEQAGARVGPFGDYLCDSPWKLVQSAVDAMVRNEPEPDFILWTGDNVPHVPDKDLDNTKLHTTIRNVTELLKHRFGPVPIYPSVGNHDVLPANQVPWKNTQYYQDLLSSAHWDRLLTADMTRTFKQGGYYTSESAHGVLRIIILNTILWYSRDTLVDKEDDPAGQFAWLRKQLMDSSHSKTKVLLTGHVPPGVLAGDVIHHSKWLYPRFNQRLVQLTQEFSDVIIGQVYGHEHLDSFHVIYSKDNEPVVPVFMGPAVTPWKTEFTSNNPSVRLYRYCTKTGQILDIKQYYLDLATANKESIADWKLEYHATTAFKIPDMGAVSLNNLLSRFSQKDNRDFDDYVLFNSVSFNKTQCKNSACKQQYICAASRVDFDDYNECINKGVSFKYYKTADTSGHHELNFTVSESRGTVTVMTVFMLIVLIIFIVLMALYRRGGTFKYTQLASPKV